MSGREDFEDALINDIEKDRLPKYRDFYFKFVGEFGAEAQNLMVHLKPFFEAEGSLGAKMVAITSLLARLVALYSKDQTEVMDDLLKSLSIYLMDAAIIGVIQDEDA